MDAVEQLIIAVAADGRTLLDPEFDPYASITASQKEFREWQKNNMERKIKSADGKEHPINKLALAEARDPASKGNKQATARTIELAEEMAQAALKVMRGPSRAICDLLLSMDGKLSMHNGQGPTPQRSDQDVDPGQRRGGGQLWLLGPRDADVPLRHHREHVWSRPAGVMQYCT